MMTPLRIEWCLTNAVVGMNLPLHLDALIAYAVTEEGLRYGTDYTNIRDIAAVLPLEKAEQDGLFCWKASALIATEVMGHDMQMWTRKFPEEDYVDYYASGKFGGLNAKFNSETNEIDLKPYAAVIDTQRGPYKNHFQHLPVRHIKKFVAYCVGDIDRITELLSPESGYIKSIGPRSRQSAGNILVDSFVIEKDEAALEAWQQRVLPWPKENYVPIQAAHKPPYWAIENRAVSYIHEDMVL